MTASFKPSTFHDDNYLWSSQDRLFWKWQIFRLCQVQVPAQRIKWWNWNYRLPYLELVSSRNKADRPNHQVFDSSLGALCPSFELDHTSTGYSYHCWQHSQVNSILCDRPQVYMNVEYLHKLEQIWPFAEMSMKMALAWPRLCITVWCASSSQSSLPTLNQNSPISQPG